MVDVLLDRVSMRHEDAWAIRDFTLRVDDGEAVVLLGPTGSGKTTVLRLIAGLEEPTSGDILLDGKPAPSEPNQRNMSMLFAESRLYPAMSARSNIGFPLSVRSTPEPEKSHRIEAEADALGIESLMERMPATLSAGQANLVNLAKAMVRAPGVFLIDEPLNAIDAKTTRELRAELRKIQQGYGATAIYATHDHDDAMALGDRLVVIREGTIRQGGSPKEVYDEPEDTFVASFVGTPEMSLLRARKTPGGVAIDDLELVAPRNIPGELLVGVRAERWIERASGLKGRVDRVEDLGSDVYVTVRTGAGTLTKRWTGSSAPDHGDEVSVVPKAYHVFDPVSGRALYHS